MRIKPYEDLLPDMVGVTKKEVEVQIAVQVETCETLESEEAEKRAKAIAEHVRRTGEGYMLFVPAECEEKAQEKIKEWQIDDVVDIIPLSFK